MPDTGDIEYELGVPIPGKIVSPDKWTRTALKKLPPAGPLNWKELFRRDAPRMLDLGCGNGRFLLASALARREMDHLGVDILPLVIRYATRRANQRGLDNVRLAVCGGHEFLERYVAHSSIQEIHLYHPQPYADTQKQERRLITPAFLARVHRALLPGGLFVVQTDNPAYWRYIAATAPQFFLLEPHNGPWPDMPEGRSRREIMARRMGLRVFRATARPRPELSDTELDALVAQLPLPTFDASARQSRGRARRRR